MNLEQLVDYLGGKREFSQNVTAWKTIPSTNARTVDFPNSIPDKIRKTLRESRVSSLYTHQAQAYQKIISGRNVVVVSTNALEQGLRNGDIQVVVSSR